MILKEGNGDGTCTNAPKYIKPKSCRVDANDFWMYKRFPFSNKGKKRSALLGFIDWLLLRVKLDFFKLHDEIYKQLGMLVVGKGSTGVTIWMDGLFHITRIKMGKNGLDRKTLVSSGSQLTKCCSLYVVASCPVHARENQ
jgi:hypothetical protein